MLASSTYRVTSDLVSGERRERLVLFGHAMRCMCPCPISENQNVLKKKVRQISFCPAEEKTAGLKARKRRKVTAKKRMSAEIGRALTPWARP